ncbi:hypothetical protein M231_03145 [Tremella mesenterica]|uniref:Uncharacterized protein n=2 Tax=Tremella mesenterica TaxID=5217 RepID=A0A4Q1BP24_TREME|nr:hypothetical protein M231_03145 [Tremella mesenterica]
MLVYASAEYATDFSFEREFRLDDGSRPTLALKGLKDDLAKWTREVLGVVLSGNVSSLQTDWDRDDLDKPKPENMTIDRKYEIALSEITVDFCGLVSGIDMVKTDEDFRKTLCDLDNGVDKFQTWWCNHREEAEVFKLYALELLAEQENPYARNLFQLLSQSQALPPYDFDYPSSQGLTAAPASISEGNRGMRQSTGDERLM